MFLTTAVQQAETAATTALTAGPAGPPVKVDAVNLELVPGHVNFALPQPSLSPAELASYNQLTQATPSATVSIDQLIANEIHWFTAKGGAQVDESRIQLFVEGNRASPVRILDMRPVKQCQAPIDGTLVYPQGGADDQSIGIGFNLDQSNPIPQDFRVGRAPDAWGGDHFQRNTVSLKQGEQQVFEITAFTSRYSCQFRIQLTVYANGQTTTQTVGDGDQPFRLTASLPWSGQPPYPGGYKSIYTDPVPPYTTIRVDPTTCGCW